MSRLSHASCRMIKALCRPGTGASSLVALAAALVIPASAGALATAGSPATPGLPGLPDGRVYELVSPANKPGSEVGKVNEGLSPYVLAGPDGDEVAYYKSGPMGDATSGLDFFSISRRSASGWATRSAVPRGEGDQAILRTNPDHGLAFSPDLTKTVFGANATFVPEQEPGSLTPHLYLYGEDGLVQWLGKPTVSRPMQFHKASGGDRLGTFAGASTDFKTVYFDYQGVLTPEGEQPNPSLGDISYATEMQALENAPTEALVNDDSFYEWREGRLREAGILPDGHMDPNGATPAAGLSVGAVETVGNQVSEDGNRAFFLSPDPKSESGRPSELYVRETAADGSQSTQLVSRDTLLPAVGGFPAAAPGGVLGGPHFYASPDGSHAFFDSTEQLTAAAPNDNNRKEYEFDTDTNTLTYLPGVADYPDESGVQMLASSRDGSRFIFVRLGTLYLWSEGTITEIAPLEVGNGELKARATSDGSVYAIQTTAAFATLGFNNGAGAYSQVYRYQASDDTLSCVSCPPAGITPSGPAFLLHPFSGGAEGNTLDGVAPGKRAMSADGSRVFFESPDPLVPQDTNGVGDAYEWEGGTVYLLSTGVSRTPSSFGDTSASGNDAFFVTAEGLVPGDNDEGFDVYDARVPRPGDQLPATAAPCEGAVCQGPPSVPQLFAAPVSETFNGPGDLAPAAPGHTATKSLTRKQKLARALRQCKREKKAAARRGCERRARQQFGAKAARGAQARDPRHTRNAQRNKGDK